jgi:hypothetical protein
MWNRTTTGTRYYPKVTYVIPAARLNLSDAESQELEELLTVYGGIFGMKNDNYGPTNRVYHSIQIWGRPNQSSNPQGDP